MMGIGLAPTVWFVLPLDVLQFRQHLNLFPGLRNSLHLAWGEGVLRQGECQLTTVQGQG